jgi:prolyl oligopeptidase
MKRFFYFLIIMAVISKAGFAQEDPYLWLEEVENPKALEWVDQWNKKTLEVLQNQKDYKAIYEKNLEIYNSTDRIADPEIYGDFIFNFWQDKQNPRGIWRRTTMNSYLSEKPAWETLIDIDKLSEQDGIKWVWKGATGLYPDYQKFMVSISKGGGDAVVIKEFDVVSKSFVDGGFELPEAKGEVSWIDKNTLMVSTDFGDGITTSGYPKQVKSWTRGTQLSDAKMLFDGEENDMGIWGYTEQTPKKTYQLITRRTSFYSGTYYVIENGKLVKLDLPNDIELSTIFNNQVILQLKSDLVANGKNLSTWIGCKHKIR